MSMITKSNRKWYNLGIVGRSQDKLDAAATELRGIGARVSAHAADVRDYPALEKAMRDARAELESIHTLICGAAGNFPLAAEQISPNGFKSVVADGGQNLPGSGPGRGRS
ncbi:MAG: SDR family NAD(P)-dependent oxidoreductase [Candidatus Competibacteraceae bacterium]|nr:MAG: SDR family NAD(P)-dependent oxidoreductase [Candidatus Competibacteraceae bacterium]